MTQQEEMTCLTIAITRLGGGYDRDLLICAGMLIQAADNQKNQTGPYHEVIQQGLQQFEILARAKHRQRMKNSERFSIDQMDEVPFVMMGNNFSQGDVYRIFKAFDLHRLSPIFISESLNDSIRRAQAAVRGETYHGLGCRPSQIVSDVTVRTTQSSKRPRIITCPKCGKNVSTDSAKCWCCDFPVPK